eukprot:CAMPEP_0197253436 /NCGR_PEP_ID=MMETSP1429-20130617/65019_1 /TAXON_ID=49237 /ORGANISM="Chaetoceros  sp., Strain UNC1202" /LENGTH=66 /DNA_ID=CAMNT_0042716113 /DNA_START=23 /DNA_END=220 /DNA_ORIENTATION=-
MIHENDRTALHVLLDNKKPSIDIVRKLIDIGEEKLLCQPNSKGQTALHIACKSTAPLGVIKVSLEK